MNLLIWEIKLISLLQPFLPVIENKSDPLNPYILFQNIQKVKVLFLLTLSVGDWKLELDAVSNYHRI